MTLLALGLNHQTAPLALRERVAIAPESATAALASLLAQPGVSEAALLSTCNRTEIYALVEPGSEQVPGRWLAEHHGLGHEQLSAYLYQHAQGEAVRHLF